MRQVSLEASEGREKHELQRRKLVLVLAGALFQG
jgi:hypothetical protein